MGLVAQTGLSQSVAGLGAGTVNATQFTQDTSSDNLNVGLVTKATFAAESVERWFKLRELQRH